MQHGAIRRLGHPGAGGRGFLNAVCTAEQRPGARWAVNRARLIWCWQVRASPRLDNPTRWPELAERLVTRRLRRVEGRFRVWGGGFPAIDQDCQRQGATGPGITLRLAVLNLNFNRVQIEWAAAGEMSTRDFWMPAFGPVPALSANWRGCRSPIAPSRIYNPSAWQDGARSGRSQRGRLAIAGPPLGCQCVSPIPMRERHFRHWRRLRDWPLARPATGECPPAKGRSWPEHTV